MKTAKFSARPSRKWTVLLIRLLSIGLIGFGAYIFVANLRGVPSSIDGRGAATTGLEITITALMALALLASLAHLVASYRLAGPDRNFLLLDREGFSYMRAGNTNAR